MEIEDLNEMIIHEDYTLANVRNDIALIRLKTTIKDAENIGIAELPSRSDASVVLDGKYAMISGFGRTSDSSGPSQFLKWVQTPLAPAEKCEKTFGKANFQDTNLCLDTVGGRSSCQGDSGGGLTVEVEGRRVLAGIVSYGAAVSCTSGFPAVYTRVTSYLDWIQEKTKIHID